MASREKVVKNQMEKTIGKEQAKYFNKDSGNLKKSGSFAVGLFKFSVLAIATHNTIENAKYKKVMKRYAALNRDEMAASHDKSSPAYWARVFEKKELDDKRAKYMKKMGHQHGSGIMRTIARIAHDNSMATMLSGQTTNVPNSVSRDDVVSNTGNRSRSTVDILSTNKNTSAEPEY